MGKPNSSLIYWDLHILWALEDVRLNPRRHHGAYKWAIMVDRGDRLALGKLGCSFWSRKSERILYETVDY